MPIYEEGRMRSMELETPLEEDELEAENLEEMEKEDDRKIEGFADGDVDNEHHYHKDYDQESYVPYNNNEYSDYPVDDNWYVKMEHRAPHEGVDFDENSDENFSEENVEYVQMVDACCDTTEVHVPTSRGWLSYHDLCFLYQWGLPLFRLSGS